MGDSGNYKTPFYCALCGSPFAQVYRTYKGGEETHPEGGNQEHEARSSYAICKGDNNSLSAEEVERAVGADHYLELKLREDQYIRARADDYGIRRAYDGRKISGEQLEWISSVRALVHRFAKVQPEGGIDQLEDDSDVYLTGQGRVAQDASWAYAPPSIEFEMEDQEGEGILESINEQYGFHLYQEPERRDRRFCYSSIPFHDQCWEILDLALHTIQESRGLPDGALGEGISLNDLWHSLASSLPTALPGKLSDLTIEALRRGTASGAFTGIQSGALARSEVMQSAGRHGWLHIDGFQWLVADPSTSPLFTQPFTLPKGGGTVRKAQSYPVSPVRNGQVEDIFFKLPPELVHEVMSLLSCREVFRWRKASVMIGQAMIPAREYRRFVLEEYDFLPQLRKKTADNFQERQIEGFDWKHVFEYMSNKCRHDDSLRNRRRIWNAVWPVADELVETSAKNLGQTDHPHDDFSLRTRVKRGYVGAMSGAEGCRHTIKFTAASADPSFTQLGEVAANENSATGSSTISDQDTPEKEPQNVLGPSNLVQGIKKVSVWLDPITQNVQGIEFYFCIREQSSGPSQFYSKRFGTPTTLRQCYSNALQDAVFLGFNICWYDGCLQGLQLVFEYAEDNASGSKKQEYLSEEYGRWSGPRRRLVATPGVSHFAGVTGFISNTNKIETFAILEETILEADSQPPTLRALSHTVPLTHHEASMWITLPPADVNILERSGPHFGNWNTYSADWHIFGSSQHNCCPEKRYESPRGKLTQIEGFWRGEYLSGLTFKYSESGIYSSIMMGNCKGDATSMMKLGEGDKILAAVISSGDLGIHSIQIITAMARATFGNRYLGTYTVYVLEDALPHDKERIGHYVYLKSRIIGFHGIYHSQLGWFLQLGLITEQISSSKSNTMVDDRIQVGSDSENDGLSCHSSSKNIPLPFVSTDEHRNIWVDNPRPSNHYPGYKKSDPLNQLPTPSQGMFVGWVSFDEPISVITTYGHFNGIKFSFLDESLPDRCFGATESGLEEGIQSLAGSDRVAAIAHQRESQVTGIKYPSHSSRQLKFLSKSSNLDESYEIEADSENLAGVQFFFTANRVIAWDPLLNRHLPTHLGRSKHCNIADQLAVVPQSLAPSLLRKYQHVIETFSHCETIDGIRAFTNVKGRFCGLQFRRNGVWDKSSLGRASKAERSFLLRPSEEFTSIKVSKAQCTGIVGAVAVC